MRARPTWWIVSAILLTLVAGVALAATAPLTISTGPATNADVGSFYSSAITASGGTAPYTYAITTGSLPPGLTLNLNTGAITGTPTTAGTFNFTGGVTDSAGTAPNPASPSIGPDSLAAARRRSLAQSGNHAAAVSTPFTIIVAPALTLAGPNSSGQVNVAYSSALTASGGTVPYTYAITTGSLPSGLTLNVNSGAITGTPNAAGTFNFTGSVTDSLAVVILDPFSPSVGPDSQAAPRRRGLAQSGNHAAAVSTPFSIIVAPAAPSPTPVPPSLWMAMTGLAGAGLFRLRQKRRA